MPETAAPVRKIQRRTTLSEMAIEISTGGGDNAMQDSVKKQGGRLRRHLTMAAEKVEGSTGVDINLSPKAKLALGGIAAGTIASAVVSPVMFVIDLAIIRAQFEGTGVGTAIKSVAKDLASGKANWSPGLPIMSVVYMSTYLTANLTETACKEMDIDYRVPTAVLTSIANCTSIAWKDKEYAKMSSGVAKQFPMASYGLFAVRDGLTVTSSFVLKNMVRDHMVESYEFEHKNADVLAAFAVPMIAQIFSTPFHILSLDLFSRPGASAASRLAEVSKGYFSVVSGRMLRIIPAFGVGGYINDVIKEASKTEDMGVGAPLTAK